MAHVLLYCLLHIQVCRRGLPVTDGFATKVENLKELTLNCLGRHNSFQFSDALDIIRCLPNLQRLQIVLVRTKLFRSNVTVKCKLYVFKTLSFHEFLQQLDFT